MDGLKMSQHTESLPRLQVFPQNKLNERHQESQQNAGRTSVNTIHSLPTRLTELLPHISATESIDLGRIRLEQRSHHKLLPPSVRSMAESFRSKSVRLSDSRTPARYDPLPYQPQFFKSSTLLKMVPIPKRHQEMFTEKNSTVSRERPFIIHSERYQYIEPFRPGFERMSQRDRLIAEQEYLDRLKMQKRAREVLPHREAKDLLMGGHQLSFSERFDVKEELRRLKAIVLPVNARELYHGKGIQLPVTHSSMRPRHKMPPPRPTVISPEPEEQSVMQAALYRGHSKASLDGIKNMKSVQKLKPVKAKLAGMHEGLVRSQTDIPISSMPIESSTMPEANIATLSVPEEEPQEQITPSPTSDQGNEEEDDVGELGLDKEDETINRAESEMDILIQSDTERQSPLKSAKVMTPMKAPTPNPLKAADLSLYKYTEVDLRSIFTKLDTDSDGHLMYQQVEPVFPEGLLPVQKKFLKHIYDIVSSSTFFGVKEFVTMKCLCDEIVLLNHEHIIKGYERVDFTTLTTTIIQYTELFQQVDRSLKGKISIESLEDILCSVLQRDKKQIEYGLSLLRTVLQLDSDDVGKVKFIAGIPYFITLAHLQPPVPEEMP